MRCNRSQAARNADSQLGERRRIGRSYGRSIPPAGFRPSGAGYPRSIVDEMRDESDLEVLYGILADLEARFASDDPRPAVVVAVEQLIAEREGTEAGGPAADQGSAESPASAR